MTKKIGIIYSPENNMQQWATCGDKRHLDQDIAIALCDGTPIEEVQRIADQRYPENDGVRGLTVEWVDRGNYFIVEDYDGSEIIHSFPKEDLHLWVEEAI